VDALNQKDTVMKEVVDVIVDAVHLHHINKSHINSDTALTQGGLNLDSIDVLEIVVAIEHKFGVKVGDAETGKKYFKSVGSISDFVILQKGQN
jgi:acyl carrier protein